MFNIFKKDYTGGEPKKTLEQLLKTQEQLNERLQKKQITKEAYLKSSEQLRKQIDKYNKQIEDTSL